MLTQYTPPEGWVGPDEGSVGQGEDGDDHEDDTSSDQTGVHIIMPIQSLVSTIRLNK